MPLPQEIDLCKPSALMVTETEPPPSFYDQAHENTSKSMNLDESDDKISLLEVSVKVDLHEDANLLFAPAELKSTSLINISSPIKDSGQCSNSDFVHPGKEDEHEICEMPLQQFRDESIIDDGFSVQYLDLRANYLQLVHYKDCESRASQFRRLALDLLSEAEISREGYATAIDALLLAAECYLNPFSTSSVSKLLCNLYNTSTKDLKESNDMEPNRFFKKSGLDQETIFSLESRRDKIVLEILLQAAELDCKYDRKLSPNSQLSPAKTSISYADMQHADSITIVRQNQALLCQFVMRYLKKDELIANKALLQSLLFLLQSSTELCCPSEDLIDVILRSAKCLNDELTSHHCHLKGGIMKLNPSKLHAIQRHSSLLQKLVIVSLGVDDDDVSSVATPINGFQCRSMVPPKSWLEKIPVFSKSPPLVRFLGWMAVSLSAKMYLRDQLFLTSNISHLTSMLSIFNDDMTLIEPVSRHSDPTDEPHTFRILCPELHSFFPTMKKQFMSFGETILEAVCHRLRFFPASAIPDILCWFSDLCTLSFLDNGKEQVSPSYSSRLAATNAKRIIIFVLDAIISEHMEAMVPEIPRVAKVLMSLCTSFHCDVNFLDAIFMRLKPLISYALRKVTQEEPVLVNGCTTDDLESLCFGEIFSFISKKSETLHGKPQIIFIVGGLYPDLSFRRKKEILLSLAEWTNFTISEPATSYLDYLLAFQCVMDNCTVSLARDLQHVGITIPTQKGESKTGFDAELLDGNPCSGHLAVKPLSVADIGDLSKAIEGLVTKLFPTIETCWDLHLTLARKLVTSITKSLLFLRCLSVVAARNDQDTADGCESSSNEYFSNSWVLSVEGLAEDILKTQQNYWWQVASCMLDYVLGLPLKFSDKSMAHLCSVITSFSCVAPRISWRLQADKWLDSLFSRDISNLSAHDHLVDMFSSMLSHWEPEQRFIVLKHLGGFVGLDLNNFISKPMAGQLSDVASILSSSVEDSVMLKMVMGLWDRISSVASSDPSMRLRADAMVLLAYFVPFVEQRKLQSFLVGAHTLPGLGKHAYMAHDVDFTRISLVLLANICVFSSSDNLSLISDDVWQRLEYIMTSKSGNLIS